MVRSIRLGWLVLGVTLALTGRAGAAPDEEEEPPQGTRTPAPQGPAPAPQAPPPAAGGRVLTAEMGDDEEGGEPQARFEAALVLLRSGREREAAAALLALARELPEDDIAPEALFEAAQVHEEQLADPETAARLYGEVARRYPQSRLSRRAQGRRDELTAGLRTGAAPYVEFQGVLRTYHQTGKTIARLEKLLREHPDFALSDRARYLLGSAYHDAGRDADAERVLGEVAASPQGEWPPRAQQLLAQLLLSHRRFAEARGRFAGLSRWGGEMWTMAAAQGVQAVDRAAGRYRAGLLCGAYLLVLAGALLWRAGRRVLRPPYEMWYYLPVAGFLLGVGYLSGGPIGRGMLALALGGAALVWLGGAAAEGTAETRKAGGWALAGRLASGTALRAAAAAALCYLAVYWGGIIDVLIETWRNGPEG